ncbi:MAG: glycosyltransferase family 39 protein [Chloroflexi bacterium]|nr:glycosyltransferase family 39 protein [Chloroflexota bacterium]
MPSNQSEDQPDPQDAGDFVVGGASSPAPSAPETDVDAAGMEAASQHGEGANSSMSRPIDDLLLSELISRWLIAPRTTWRSLRMLARRYPARNRTSDRASYSTLSLALAESRTSNGGALASLSALPNKLRQLGAMQLLLCGIAVVCAISGSVIARGTDTVSRAGGYSLSVAAPYLWLGFLIWLGAETLGNWTQLRGRWRRLNPVARLRWAARAICVAIWLVALFTLTASMTAPRERATELALSALGYFAAGSLAWIVIEIVYWRARKQAGTLNGAASNVLERQPIRLPIAADISPLRKLMVAFAGLCSLVVWMNTTGNRIEPPIVLLWLASAALWGFVFAPLRWNVFDWASGRLDAMRRLRWRDHRSAIIAFALIMMLGAAFRFNMLDAYPPQMYSDLVEKIQDAYKIYSFDDYRIFFENIGGREPLHFYLLSILASQPGMEFNHFALKLMSALESMITLPIVFWLGVEVAGKRRREIGLLLGLLAAGFVAVSFWHAAIGRQGMRISLAPLFSALTAVYLVRALRGNQRPDYVKAGLALGFGLLGYQAVRMLPLAAVGGVLIAGALAGKTMRARLSYLLNLAVLAFVAFMVFLPLFHYWMEEPENYMRRTNTRIFGDLPTTDAERASFVMESVPVLLNNIRKTALVFHFFGDSSWVSGLSSEPAMDPVTAGFMTLGIAAWLALILKTRDPTIVFVPVYLIATLLPTALALSFPIEVPSFIRASGAIPPSYLIAALPVAVFCLRLCKTTSGRFGHALAALFAAAVLLAANHYNTSLYFGEFTDNYRRASHPQAQAGKLLKGFAESDGAFGNAFILASPHWWDIRAIGIEAGLMYWDSGGDVAIVPQLLSRGLRRDGRFRLDPERDLLFFYARDDMDALPLLSEWFPAGRQMEIRVQPAHKSFYIFRAPGLGADGLQRFLEENAPA